MRRVNRAAAPAGRKALKVAEIKECRLFGALTSLGKRIDESREKRIA
jgi:hypothetical protein